MTQYDYDISLIIIPLGPLAKAHLSSVIEVIILIKKCWALHLVNLAIWYLILYLFIKSKYLLLYIWYKCAQQKISLFVVVTVVPHISKEFNVFIFVDVVGIILLNGRFYVLFQKKKKLSKCKAKQKRSANQ